VKRKEKTERWS